MRTALSICKQNIKNACVCVCVELWRTIKYKHHSNKVLANNVDSVYEIYLHHTNGNHGAKNVWHSEG